MISLGIVLTFAIRVGLVLLFLPFSALDKLLNFKGAVAQASEVAPSRMIAVGLIVAGLCVEVFMSLGRRDRNRGPRLRLRSRRLLRCHSIAMEAILETGGFLDLEYRTGTDPVLGLSEKLRARCWVSADHIRNRRAFSRSIHGSSDGFLASLSCGRPIDAPMIPALRLARIEMVCGDPEALAEFYQAAFGFLRPGPAPTPATSGGVELRLGGQTIRLIRAQTGRPQLSRRCRRLEPAIPAYCDRCRRYGASVRTSFHTPGMDTDLDIRTSSFASCVRRCQRIQVSRSGGPSAGIDCVSTPCRSARNGRRHCKIFAWESIIPRSQFPARRPASNFMKASA